MHFIIEGYIKNLTKADVNNFALKNSINLTNDELNFTYNFIKSEYKQILNNPNNFNFSNYKDRFSSNNYMKIESLIKKYSSYL